MPSSQSNGNDGGRQRADSGRGGVPAISATQPHMAPPSVAAGFLGWSPSENPAASITTPTPQPVNNRIQ